MCFYPFYPLFHIPPASHIAIHSPDGHLAGGQGGPPAVRILHHQPELVVDLQGKGLLPGDGGDQLHLVARGQAVRPVPGQILRFVVRKSGVHPVQCPNDLHRQLRPAHRTAQLLGQRDGDGTHLWKKILRPLVHIHTNAGDEVVQGVALALQAQLCEDAAQLPPSQHDVVGPLDPGADAAGGLDAVAHRHRQDVHHLAGIGDDGVMVLRRGFDHVPAAQIGRDPFHQRHMLRRAVRPGRQDKVGPPEQSGLRMKDAGGLLARHGVAADKIHCTGQHLGRADICA